MTKAKKVNITLSKKAVEELEALKKELDLPSIAEVIRSSISINRFLQLEKERGNDIVLRNRETKGEKTLIFHR